MNFPRCLPTFAVTLYFVHRVFLCERAGRCVWGAPSPSADPGAQSSPQSVIIPGPLRSFLRMAGVS